MMIRLKHISEVDTHAAILTRNLFRKVRALFGSSFEKVNGSGRVRLWIDFHCQDVCACKRHFIQWILQ